jgi:hypothetical protein
LLRIELSPSFSLSFFAPKYSEGNDTKKKAELEVPRGSLQTAKLLHSIQFTLHNDVAE